MTPRVPQFPTHKQKRFMRVRLLKNEEDALKSGQLVDVTHKNASSVWLEAPSSVLDANADKCCIYRHMGDIEFAHLMSNGTLPDTQPYQTITRGPEGRSYCESYLRGTKKVDSDPTTVVEFICDKSMIDSF